MSLADGVVEHRVPLVVLVALEGALASHDTPGAMRESIPTDLAADPR